jgi:hypothetical protein
MNDACDSTRARTYARTHARTHTHTRRHGSEAKHQTDALEQTRTKLPWHISSFHGTPATGTGQQYLLRSKRLFHCVEVHLALRELSLQVRELCKGLYQHEAPATDTCHQHCGHARAHGGSCTPPAGRLASRRTLAQRRDGRPRAPPSFAATPTLARRSEGNNGRQRSAHVSPRQCKRGTRATFRT